MCIGTWVAAVATFAAVAVALYLSRRSERIRLKVTAGIRLLLLDSGVPSDRIVLINFVNLGDRTVVVNSVGWKIGKGTKARLCVQTGSGPRNSNIPKFLAHGESGSLVVSLNETPAWAVDFVSDFILDLSDKNLKTLRVWVHTSLGETVEAVPENNIIEEIRKVKLT